MAMEDVVPVPLKRCTKCLRELPLTTEFYYANKSKPAGFESMCKDCAKTAQLNRYYADHENNLIKKRSAYHKNPDKHSIRAKQYRESHLEILREKDRAYKAANIERRLTYNRIWAAKNREKVREYSRRWASKNRSRTHKNVLVRRARRRALPANWTRQNWLSCLSYFEGKCAYCGNPPGLFRNMGMNADHFIPLASDKCPGTVPENIVPACVSCNSSKSDKLPEQWLIGKFGARKAKKILRRIADYFASLRGA